MKNLLTILLIALTAYKVHANDNRPNNLTDTVKGLKLVPHLHPQIPIKDNNRSVTIINIYNKEYAIVDKEGKLVKKLKDFSYIDVEPFHQGFMLTATLNKVEIIDENGKNIHTIKLDKKMVQNVAHVGENMFAVEIYGKKWAYFDKQGKQLTDFIYGEPSAFENGLALFSNSRGVMDKNLNQVIPSNIYDKLILNYTDKNLIWASKRQNFKSKVGLIDINQKIIIPFDYTYLTYKGKGLFMYSKLDYAYSEVPLSGLLTIENKIISDEVLPRSMSEFADDGTAKMKFGNKDYVILTNGTFTPNDGELEFQIAKASIPGYNINHWQTTIKNLQLGIKKNNNKAIKLYDSLKNEPTFLAHNPEIKDEHEKSLEKEANLGNVNSMHHLGLAYLKGSKHYPKNTEKGIQWLQQASNKNHQKALYDLVYHYIRNLDEVKAQEALSNYKGPKNFQLEQLYVPGGLYHTLARFSGKDEQKLESYYSKAIALGNLDAAYDYGVRLISSTDANKIAKGIKIMEKNCQKGQVKSMTMLGNYYSIYASNPTRIDRNKSNAYFNLAINSRKASISEKREAEIGILENRKNEPLAVGTIIEINNQRKAIVFRDTFGFRTNDNTYYASALSNYTDFKNYNIIKGITGTKKCASCNGTGKQQKQVVSGSYTTKDVTYKTGSTISGDKKITTTTTHNTYKSVDEKCLVCNGNGLVAN
ncbi:tetratricopeptide repeat protein [Pedobacter sp. SL55]|uniref:tetratricopeptide repeat protein n=1 Tax=Pedobacter sp. SL55 TaxID=2995161 RepID=UPI0022722001|nr:hypothetical protein [Pedobacter sp. SL55]WAC40128.1 hypothetical protein OVA16_16330 [Pedobacter sp. SL55]